MSGTAPEDQQRSTPTVGVPGPARPVDSVPTDAADPAPGAGSASTDAADPTRSASSVPTDADPAGSADAASTEPQRPAGRRWLPESLVALCVAATLAVVGLPIGWLWSVAAPRVPVEMTTDGPMLADPQPEQYIADEGWYIFLTIAVGALAALLVWALLRRHRGPVLLVGLALGSAVGGVLAWWLGSHIGLSHYHDLLEHAPVGSRFSRPVGLRVQRVGLWRGWLPMARGDVLSGAIAATLVYALLAGFSPSASLNTAPDADGEDESGEAVPVPNQSDAGPDEVSSDSSATPDQSATPVPPGPDATAPPHG